jgi:uncharacterized protein YhhL (DUF1145 family)
VSHLHVYSQGDSPRRKGILLFFWRPIVVDLVRPYAHAQPCLIIPSARCTLGVQAVCGYGTQQSGRDRGRVLPFGHRDLQVSDTFHSVSEVPRCALIGC